MLCLEHKGVINLPGLGFDLDGENGPGLMRAY